MSKREHNYHKSNRNNIPHSVSRGAEFASSNFFDSIIIVHFQHDPNHLQIPSIMEINLCVPEPVHQRQKRVGFMFQGSKPEPNQNKLFFKKISVFQIFQRLLEHARVNLVNIISLVILLILRG